MTADVLAGRAKYCTTAFLFVLLALGAAPRVAAQGGASAVVSGVVVDTQGGVLPGVTVEAASPVLIERVKTAVTDGNGSISQAEFAAAHEGKADRIAKYDANSDGMIDAAELDAAHADKGDAKADMEGKCGEGKCGGSM